MWLWWVMILIEDLTYVTLAIEDAYGDEEDEQNLCQIPKNSTTAHCTVACHSHSQPAIYSSCSMFSSSPHICENLHRLGVVCHLLTKRWHIVYFLIFYLFVQAERSWWGWAIIVSERVILGGFSPIPSFCNVERSPGEILPMTFKIFEACTHRFSGFCARNLICGISDLSSDRSSWRYLTLDYLLFCCRQHWALINFSLEWIFPLNEWFSFF